MFITQVFTRVPPKIDRKPALAVARQKFMAARPKLVDAPTLDGLAQQLANGLAAGESAEAAYQAISGQVNGLGRVYQRVGSVITAVADLDAVDGAGLLAGSAADEIGLGIAQGTHPQIGDNAIWIVALLGERRLP
jgi:hypothetical protein